MNMNEYHSDGTITVASSVVDYPAGTITVASSVVDHPAHYGGADNPYEAIKVIRAWDLNFSLGNTIKYISRAGKKNPNNTIEDLEKALWYLQEEITCRKQNKV